MNYQLTTIARPGYNLTCSSADLEELRRAAAGWLEQYGYISMLSPVLPSLDDILAEWEKSLAPRPTIDVTKPAPVAPAREIEPPTVPGRYIPNGYEYRCNEFGVVYYTEFPKPVAIAYIGKQRRSVWYIRFRTAERMHEEITSHLDGLERRAADKKAAQEKRKAFDAREHWKIGDIVYNSWGYEQTNIDFYQIVSVTAKFVNVRPIARTLVHDSMIGAMSGNVAPIPDSFTGPIEKHAANRPDHINFRFGCGSRYDGKPVHCTWYG